MQANQTTHAHINENRKVHQAERKIGKQSVLTTHASKWGVINQGRQIMHAHINENRNIHQARRKIGQQPLTLRNGLLTTKAGKTNKNIPHARINEHCNNHQSGRAITQQTSLTTHVSNWGAGSHGSEHMHARINENRRRNTHTARREVAHACNCGVGNKGRQPECMHH